MHWPYLWQWRPTNKLRIFNNSSVTLICKRTSLTQQPLLVGEVSSNFCGSLLLYFRFSKPDLLLFLLSSSSIVLTRTSFQTNYFSENFIVLGIEPGRLTSRPQRQWEYLNVHINTCHNLGFISDSQKLIDLVTRRCLASHFADFGLHEWCCQYLKIYHRMVWEFVNNELERKTGTC
jgi:hypothetical protein